MSNDNTQPDPQLQAALDRSQDRSIAGLSKVTLGLGAAVLLIGGFVGGYAVNGLTGSNDQGPGGRNGFPGSGYGRMGEGYGFPGGGQMPSGNPPSGMPQGGGNPPSGGPQGAAGQS